MCGEKRSAFPVLPCGWGSPPRMRGKAREVLLHPEAVGITPAYAGKRIKLRKRHSICGDHPCVCGEKIEMPYELLLKEGSPPRMRGKARSRCFVVEVMRITPAYAGKRIAELQTPAVSWDHPRVCGEKVPITCVPKYALGSPPRVRGKVCWRERHRPVPGITPACAGKSGRTSGLTRPARDHPRACGEKSTSTSMMNCGWGSPPRVRGKDGNQSTGQHRGRITPAYAGKSFFSCVVVLY